MKKFIYLLINILLTIIIEGNKCSNEQNEMILV